MSESQPESGFSIAEVIVAFAILSIALVAIFKSYGLVSHGTIASEQEHEGLATARSLLATTGVIDQLQPGIDNGAADQGMVWSRTVSAYSPAGASDTLRTYLVTIEVAVPGKLSGNSIISLSTLKLATVR